MPGSGTGVCSAYSHCTARTGCTGPARRTPRHFRKAGTAGPARCHPASLPRRIAFHRARRFAGGGARGGGVKPPRFFGWVAATPSGKRRFQRDLHHIAKAAFALV